MTNISLDAQADVLLERSKRLAKRAREAKVKAAQAKSKYKAATENLLGIALVHALCSGRLGYPAAWLVNLGLSQSDLERVWDFILPLIPAPVVPLPVRDEHFSVPLIVRVSDHALENSDKLNQDKVE